MLTLFKVDYRNKISASDLAKQGEELRKKRKKKAEVDKEEAKKIGLSYRRSTDQRRIFTHLSSWSDRTFLFIFFGFLSGIGLITVFFFQIGVDGFKDLFDNGLLIGMIGITAGFILLAIVSRRLIKKQVLAEKEWIDNQPYKLIAYPDILVYRSYPSVTFTFEFKRKTPEIEHILNVLATLPYKVTSKVEFDYPDMRDDEDYVVDLTPPSIEFWDSDEEDKEVTELPKNAIDVVYKFEVRNKKGSKFNRHRRWVCRWIHQACEVQFKAIHQQYPIKSITFGNGNEELDFDWWVPRKRKWWMLAISMLILLGSCGDGVEGVIEKETEPVQDVYFDDASLYDDIGCMPSPLQYVSIFKKAGIEFHSEALSDSNLDLTESDTLKKRLIFGVYSTDFIYCINEEEVASAQKYMTFVKDLSKEIGLEKVFNNEELTNRFEANLDNRDSTEIIMITMQERYEQHMEENDLMHLSAIHFAAAWVEGMYLGVYDMEIVDRRDYVGAQLSEQMAILGNVIKGLKDPKNNQEQLKWLINDLEKIQLTFDCFDSVIKYYDDEDMEELILLNEEIEEMSELIKELRAKIVEGEYKDS